MRAVAKSHTSHTLAQCPGINKLALSLVCFVVRLFFVCLMEIQSKQSEQREKADEIKFVVGTDVSSQTIAIISNAFAEPTLRYGNFRPCNKKTASPL